MKELYSIRLREKTYRIIIIASFLVSGTISAVSLIYSYNTIQESKKNIYVLENSKALVKAKSTDINNSYDILVKNQIQTINQLIYQQVPDPDNMNKQLKQALVISDKSTANIIDALKTHEYFNNIINQNFYTLLITDSISVNYSQNPHPFKYVGTLKIIRNNQSANRKIVTSGEIQATNITTESNERGFLIRNFKLISDREDK